MVRVLRYESGRKAQWDEFVSRSKNGLFLFKRDYMEYHSDRFADCSVMFFKDETLLAVMPCNMAGDSAASHGGLTFGGVVTDMKMRTSVMLEVFDALASHLRDGGVRVLRYKAVPHIYHTVPAEEDLYALFRNNARLVRRDVSTSIYRGSKPGMSERRRRGIKKAQKNGVTVRADSDFRSYMGLVSSVLESRYKASPVHSGDEMSMLAGRFPENIRLFTAYRGDESLAGVIIYESANVAHAQYIANSPEGRDVGALDLVFDYLLTDYYREKKFFDFGISNESDGRFLNEGLICQKEEFGARAVAYDTYEMELG